MIVLAAAEVGVGLAIVLQLYRLRRTVTLDTLSLAPSDEEPAPAGAGSAPADLGAAPATDGRVDR